MERRLSDCVIFDIDGVLADHRHRLHYVIGRDRNYTAFHDAMAQDKPIAPMIALACNLSQWNCLLLITGRPESHRQMTLAWLDQHEVPGEVIMRKADDHRKDDVVKLELLDEARDRGWQPWLAIEDRPHIAAMYREQGIFCLQAPEATGIRPPSVPDRRRLSTLDPADRDGLSFAPRKYRR